MIESQTVVFVSFSNESSGAISWNSKLQTTVATSRAEAEAMSLFAASQELEFLRNLATEVGIDTSRPAKLFVDNQACIAITKNTVNSQKVKHFAIKLSFIHEKIELKHFRCCILSNHRYDYRLAYQSTGKDQG